MAPFFYLSKNFESLARPVSAFAVIMNPDVHQDKTLWLLHNSVTS